MTDVVKKQILAIRDTGLTNMFDVTTVRQIAVTCGYDELVSYLKTHKGEYARFIMTGETE